MKDTLYFYSELLVTVYIHVQTIKQMYKLVYKLIRLSE